MSPIKRLRVKRGRETPFRAGHPWVFSGALIDSSPAVKSGEIVALVDSQDSFIAYGCYNPDSQITVRLYSWDESVVPDRSLLASRILGAIKLRKSVLQMCTTESGCRLVFSEADKLSGLTVDAYGSHLSIQVTSLFVHNSLKDIIDILEQELRPLSIILRTEKGIKEQEGLDIKDTILYGESTNDYASINEHGLYYTVNLKEGHKTGFYLDQRNNRLRIRDFAGSKDCLDICCYSGGFTMNMLKGGAASVVAVDASQNALTLAEQNCTLNGLSGKVSFLKGDAFTIMERLKNEKRKFGLIVLDPPKFAQSARGIDQAVKGYERLNRLALSLLEPDGILVSCSCSGRVSPDLFRNAIRNAAINEKRMVRIFEERGAAPDHPVHPAIPETAYLKCFICCVE